MFISILRVRDITAIYSYAADMEKKTLQIREK